MAQQIDALILDCCPLDLAATPLSELNARAKAAALVKACGVDGLKVAQKWIIDSDPRVALEAFHAILLSAPSKVRIQAIQLCLERINHVKAHDCLRLLEETGNAGLLGRCQRELIESIQRQFNDRTLEALERVGRHCRHPGILMVYAKLLRFWPDASAGTGDLVLKLNRHGGMWKESDESFEMARNLVWAAVLNDRRVVREFAWKQINSLIELPRYGDFLSQDEVVAQSFSQEIVRMLEAVSPRLRWVESAGKWKVQPRD